MVEQWLERLKKNMPKLESAEQIVQTLVSWPWDKPPEAWVDQAAALAALPFVSHVFLDPALGGGGRLCLRVDGLVMPAWPLSAEQRERFQSALTERASATLPGSTSQLTEGVFAGSVESGPSHYWLGVFRTLSGLQLTLCPLYPASRRPPWEKWPEQARNAASQINWHPNGLIVFCHRSWSTERRGTMAEWFLARVNPGSRFAYVTDGPVMMAPTDDVFTVRVDGTRKSWQESLSALVAQNFDVIAIAGRDEAEAFRQALITALEDRYVLTNVSATGALDALLWIAGNPAFDMSQVAAELIGVVGTRRLRRICPLCSYRAQPNEETLSALEQQAITPLPEGDWVQSKGCDECNGTGFILPSREMLQLVEIVYVDRDLARIVESRPGRPELEAALRKGGFRTYFEQAFELARQGLTTPQEAIYYGLARRADL